MPPRADLLFDCSDINSTLLQNSVGMPVVKQSHPPSSPSMRLYEMSVRRLYRQYNSEACHGSGN